MLRIKSIFYLLSLTLWKAEATDENAELTESLSSLFMDEGGNLLREAIEFLQLEKIEDLESKIEFGEMKILDLEKEVQKLHREHADEKQRLLQEMEKQVISTQEDFGNIILDKDKEIQKCQQYHTEKVQKLHQDHADEKQRLLQEQEKQDKSMQNDFETLNKTLNKKIKNHEMVLNFVMKVLEKGENMMKSRQDVIESQSAYIKEKEKQLGQCKILQETVSQQKTVIETQTTKISDLEKTVTSNEDLNLAYEKINESFLAKTDCDIPPWVSSITEGLTKQQETIVLLKSSMQQNEKLKTGCEDLKKSFPKLSWESNENTTLISHYQTLVQKQSQTITMFRNQITGMRYQEEDGLIVSGSPCECLPLPPSTSSLELTTVKFECPENDLAKMSYHVTCSEGKCETEEWPACSALQSKDYTNFYDNCSPVTKDYLNTTVDCGAGSKTSVLEKSTGQGVFRQELFFPCLECTSEMFEWSSWSSDGQGTQIRVRGNNTILEDSYQEQQKSVWLVGGNEHSYGNVFVKNSDGYEGPVCDDGWENIQATIVCKELGFRSGIPTLESNFGSVGGRFAMDDVSCSGSESSILQCKYSRFDDCEGNEAAGVRCSA